MKNNQPEIPIEKKGSYPLKLTISVLITVVFFIADLYFMINPNIIGLLIFTVLLLVGIYVAMDTILKNIQKKNQLMQEQYDLIFKSDKASYLLLRKTYDDLSEQIKNAGAANDSMDEIINTQKAAAKLIIGRNKENTDALMNSNDSVVEKMFAMQTSLGQLHQDIIAKQEAFSTKFNEEVMMQQDKLFIELNNAEASISNHLQQMNEKLSGFQEEVEKLADHLAEIGGNMSAAAAMAATSARATMAEMPAAKPAAEAFSPEPAVSEIPVAETIEPDITFDEPVTAEENLEDSIDSIMASLGDLDLEEESLDEFPDDLTLGAADEEFKADALDDDLSLGKEFALDDDLSLGDDLSLEGLLDEPIIDEPIVEEPASAMPDLSEPGKMMTPEEIEALIAGTLGSDPAPAEPVVEEPIIEEPAPTPMPDLSDPGKMMTPEEIAALIAGTTDSAPVVEEPVIEEPAPAPMPDLSDPGKMMTPEEIAALIANI